MKKNRRSKCNANSIRFKSNITFSDDLYKRIQRYMSTQKFFQFNRYTNKYPNFKCPIDTRFLQKISKQVINYEAKFGSKIKAKHTVDKENDNYL